MARPPLPPPLFFSRYSFENGLHRHTLYAGILGGVFFFSVFFIPDRVDRRYRRVTSLLFFIISYDGGYSTRVLGYRWEALGD